jgi:preprotein translocase subunit SecG
MPTFLALLGMVISVMLIGLILLQRGRGGGLVGALSGLGGQSAFGTKAGDTFTRITIAIAAVWVLLAGIHGQVLRAKTVKFKNETTTKEMGSSSKDKEDASSKSSDSKKEESGLDSSSGESKDEGSKESDASKKTKSDDASKELPPDDDKKSEAAPKSKEPPKKELEEPADGKSDDKSGEKK